LCSALFDFSNIDEVLAAAQMFGGVNNIAGLVLPAVPHEPRTMVCVQAAMLITEICFSSLTWAFNNIRIIGSRRRW
jgi:hypothetical protein